MREGVALGATRHLGGFGPCEGRTVTRKCLLSLF